MEQKGYKIQNRFNATAQFEISVDTNGWNFVLIYGHHVNGYYCCIPGWNVGCEMSEPADTFYNKQQLQKSAHLMEEGSQKILLSVARPLAIAIKDFAKQIEEKRAIPVEKTFIEEMKEMLAKENSFAGEYVKLTEEELAKETAR